MTRYGTSHFTDFYAACAYYRAYGLSSDDVQAKIDAAEIHIGQPETQPDQRIQTDGTRYFIEEN